MSDANKVTEAVQEYYGKTLQKSADLKTNACCTIEAPPEHIKKAISNIHDEVMEKYYGCGLVIPTELEGLKVLDLGSGSGRDCYILSQLVGESGEVVGVDMTPEQLEVSKKYIDWHKEKFGYQNSNTSFLEGNIERLEDLNLEDESFDLIISNCVINLATDKQAVLDQVFKLLRPGGEMYFSDVYSDRRIPEKLQKDPVLYGECLSGALYWKDFLNMSKQAGFKDPRHVEDSVITINNDEVSSKTKGINFHSVTYRLFKNQELDFQKENYGQSVTFKGNAENNSEFRFDKDFLFQKDKSTPVDRNTYKMLKDSRLNRNFEFSSSCCLEHLGPFETEGSSEGSQFTNQSSSQSCC